LSTNIPTLNGENLWSGSNTFTGNIILLVTNAPGVVHPVGIAAFGDTNSNQENLFIGYNPAVTNHAPGLWQGNIGIGQYVFDQANPGDLIQYCLGLGLYALNNFTNGNGCIALGVDALAATYSANNTIGIGHGAANYAYADDDICIGVSSGHYLGSGSNCVFIGSASGLSYTNTSGIVGVGFQALASEISGVACTAVGHRAATLATAPGITALGCNALNHDTGGDGYHIAIGVGALAWAGDGSAYDIAVGNNALYYMSSGAENTAVGTSSGQEITSGSYNSILGCSAGLTLTTGAFNLLLGHSADTTAATATNAIALGYNVKAPSGYCVIGASNDAAPFFGTRLNGTLGVQETVTATNGVISVGQYNSTAGTMFTWTSNNLYAGKITVSGSPAYLTNTVVTTNSIVLATLNTDDALASGLRAIPSAGLITFKFLAAPAGNVDISWKVESP